MKTTILLLIALVGASTTSAYPPPPWDPTGEPIPMNWTATRGAYRGTKKCGLIVDGAASPCGRDIRAVCRFRISYQEGDINHCGAEAPAPQIHYTLLLKEFKRGQRPRILHRHEGQQPLYYDENENVLGTWDYYNTCSGNPPITSPAFDSSIIPAGGGVAPTIGMEWYTGYDCQTDTYSTNWPFTEHLLRSSNPTSRMISSTSGIATFAAKSLIHNGVCAT